MPGSFTDFEEAKLLNWLFGGIPHPIPPYHYWGYLVSPGDEGGVAVEPNSGGYARISVANTAQNFAVTSNQTKSNATEILFNRATASHGIVQAIGIYDAPNGGNLLIYAPLAQPQLIDVNDSFRIEAGGFTIAWQPGGLSNYVKNGLLNHLFGAVPFNVPSSYWLGWMKTTPTDAVPGAEPTGGSYGRISVANNTNTFPNVANGAKSTAVGFDFPEATADLGTATHLGIWDASSAGNFYAHGILGGVAQPQPKPIGLNAVFVVLPGDLVFSLD